MRGTRILVLLALLALVPALALAATPLGGLAVAVSPDGKTLAAAGDNRALYVIDAAKLEVTGRVWLKTCVVDLRFNKAGSTLVLEDTDGTLHLLDAKTWRELKQQPKAAKLAAAPLADLAAGLDDNYNGNLVRVFSLTDLAEKTKVAFEKGQRVAGLGLDAQGARLAVLMEPVKDETEPTVNTPPAGVKGLEAEDFKLKNDGKTSLMAVFEVPSGKKLWEKKIYFSPSAGGTRVYFAGDKVLIANYYNLNALVAPDGAVTLFQLESSFNYGLGASDDQKVLLGGGLSLATRAEVEGLVKVKVEPDRLSGWPEYFKGFAVGPDGAAYGSTSSYRIIKIGPSGAFEKGAPVY